jgi:hypothetical protein
MTVGTGDQPAGVAPDPGIVPAGRRAARASTVMWAALVLVAFTGAALAVVARGGLKASDLLSNLGSAVAVVAYATLGTLTVRRAGARWPRLVLLPVPGGTSLIFPNPFG